jgi:hypothetical protein
MLGVSFFDGRKTSRHERGKIGVETGSSTGRKTGCTNNDPGCNDPFLPESAM